MSDLTKRLVALANSLGGTEEADIMEGVAEIERLQAERDDWRDTAEDGAKMMRAEIERLDIIIVELIILAREHGIGEKKIRKIVEMEQSGRKRQNRQKPQSDQ